MLTLLPHVSDLELPAELSDVPGRASELWSDGKDSDLDLLVLKQRCWNYLDHHKDDDVRSKHARNVRALLGVLEPSGDDDAGSATAEWVCDMRTV